MNYKRILMATVSPLAMVAAVLEGCDPPDWLAAYRAARETPATGD